MTDAPRADVLFYVQHLLGVGHLRRAAVVAEALERAGLAVVFVTGGPPDPLVAPRVKDLVQLAPLRVLDESFRLVDADGRPLDEAMKARRRDSLLEVFHRRRPRCLLIELFPFGRRQMRFELLPQLEAAAETRPRPRILCSLRDILNRSDRPEKTRWMLETFARHFDRAIVHGDPRLIPLEASFPEAQGIADRLVYSGYVVTPGLAEQTDLSLKCDGLEGEVLVSAGGGAVGLPLARAALQAKPLSTLADRPWRLLLGHNLPAAAFDAMRAEAGPGVAVERARPDFPQRLARCRLSISQAGYNTVMEVLNCRRAAVVVPFAAGSETEQSLRAALFARRGLLSVVEERTLTPETLAEGIVRALAREERLAEIDLPNLEGAAETAAIVKAELAETEKGDVAPPAGAKRAS